VDIYNSVLSLSSLLEHSSVVIAYDNEALYDICDQKLENTKPNFQSLNKIIA
jgi:tubulin alpha